MSEPGKLSFEQRVSLLGVDTTFGTHKPKFVCSRETLRRLLLCYAWLDNASYSRELWIKLGMALRYEVPEAQALFEAKSLEWGTSHKVALSAVWESLQPDGSVNGKSILYAFHNERRLLGMSNGHDLEIMPAAYGHLLDLVDDVCELLAGSLPAESELRGADADAGAQIVAAVSGEAVAASNQASPEPTLQDDAAVIHFLRDTTWFDPDSWTAEMKAALELIGMHQPWRWLTPELGPTRNRLIVASVVRLGGRYAVRGLPMSRVHLFEPAELTVVFHGLPMVGRGKALRRPKFVDFLAEALDVEEARYSRTLPGCLEPFPRDEQGRTVINRWLGERLSHWQPVMVMAIEQGWRPASIRLLQRQIELIAGQDSAAVLDTLSWFVRSIWLQRRPPVPRLSFGLICYSADTGIGKSTLALLLRRFAGGVDGDPGIRYEFELDPSGWSRFDSGQLSDALVVELPEISRERGQEAHLDQTLKALLPTVDPNAFYRSERKGKDAAPMRRCISLVIGTTNRIEALHMPRQQRRALIVGPPEELPGDARQVRQQFYNAVTGDHKFVIETAAWLLSRTVADGFDPSRAPRTAMAEVAWRAGGDGLQGRIVDLVGDSAGPFAVAMLEERLTIRGQVPTAQQLARVMIQLGFQLMTIRLRLTDTANVRTERKFSLWWKREAAEAAGFNVILWQERDRQRWVLSGGEGLALLRQTLPIAMKSQFSELS